MTTDPESRISALLHALPVEPRTDISVEQVRARAAHQRRTQLATVATAAVVAAVAIVVPLVLDSSQPHHSVVIGPTHPVFPGTVLGVDRAGRLVIEQPSNPSSATVVRYRLGIPSYPAIAGAGAAGWVASVGFTPPPRRNAQGHIQAATVGPDGTVQPFGPVIRDGAISSLAVSPDGHELAMGVEGGATTIRVLPMPGVHGPRRMWTLPHYDELRNLSWSPDGRQLSYVAGENTGDGIGGPPAFLDTRSRAATATDASPWGMAAPGHCPVARGGWIGAHGGYAVLEWCRHGDALRRVEPRTGRPTGGPVTLPGSDCLDGQLAGASAASQLLVSWCNTVYFIRNGTAYPLPGNLRVAAAAWTVRGG